MHYAMIGGAKVILMKPLSFMNLSGGPVREMANYFKIDPESELIIIQDDIDLERQLLYSEAGQCRRS